jgi:hypothetical protein
MEEELLSDHEEIDGAVTEIVGGAVASSNEAEGGDHDASASPLPADDTKATRRDYTFSCMGRCQRTNIAGLRLVCTDCFPRK